jgi:hypothetical protein
MASGITFQEMPERATLKYAQLAISGGRFPPLRETPPTPTAAQREISRRVG